MDDSGKIKYASQLQTGSRFHSLETPAASCGLCKAAILIDGSSYRFLLSKIISLDLVLRNVGVEVLLARWWHVCLALFLLT